MVGQNVTLQLIGKKNFREDHFHEIFREIYFTEKLIETLFLQDLLKVETTEQNSGRTRSDSVSLLDAFVKHRPGSGSSLSWSSSTPAQLLWNITINLNGSQNSYVRELM